MKPKQKHFLNEASIVKEIDRVRARIQERRQELSEKNEKMESFIKANVNGGFNSDIHFCETKIDMMEKSIMRYEVKLERLKETLAAFKTELLPGFFGRQVVLEKLR